MKHANLLPQVQEFAQIISSADMPWFRNVTGPKFETPMFFHSLLGRGTTEPNSSLYYPALELFNNFCGLTNTRYKNILRMCLNLTVPLDYCQQIEPHVDYEVPHKLFLLYLNDCSGNTLIYNEKYGEFGAGEFYLDLNEYKNKLSVRYEVPPKTGLAICFDGAHYHAHKLCQGKEARKVLVICFQE